TSTAPVGACASVHWNQLLGDSARSQGGPRWVSVASAVHDQGPRSVPRYLDRLNGRDRPLESHCHRADRTVHVLSAGGVEDGRLRPAPESAREGTSPPKGWHAGGRGRDKS